jgi:hypothetical protein
LIAARITAAMFAASCGAAYPAGGHHDVDDATILAPGHCQIEAWVLRGRRSNLALQHIGPACNFGGLEWGLNVDRVRLDGERSDGVGPQVKWVLDPAAKRLSLGAVLGVTWLSHGPAKPLVTGYVPATWWLGTDGEVQLNANLGQDKGIEGVHFGRWGIGVDWTVNDRLVLTAERRLQFAQELSRLGARLNLTPLVSVDLSVGRNANARLGALGLNWEWDR